MRSEPPYVHKKVVQGYTYYYFVPTASGRSGRRRYIPLPDISDPAFDEAYSLLLAQHPRVRKPSDFSDAPSMIYFIGGDVGGIKIGRTIRPHMRLVRLQIGSPIEIRILAVEPGGVAEEKAYHRRFASSRMHGEWFARTPELLAHIGHLNETSPYKTVENGG